MEDWVKNPAASESAQRLQAHLTASCKGWTGVGVGLDEKGKPAFYVYCEAAKTKKPQLGDKWEDYTVFLRPCGKPKLAKEK